VWSAETSETYRTQLRVVHVLTSPLLISLVLTVLTTGVTGVRGPNQPKFGGFAGSVAVRYPLLTAVRCGQLEQVKLIERNSV
jgi:hypothetical protein